MLMTHESTTRNHVRRLVVTTMSDGWEVREEEDAGVISVVRRYDWHRVERDCLLFDLRERQLTFARSTVNVELLAECYVAATTASDTGTSTLDLCRSQ
jgi:hypothetical protein